MPKKNKVKESMIMRLSDEGGQILDELFYSQVDYDYYSKGD